MTSRHERLVENQRRFRRANERLRERVAVMVDDHQEIPFLCECADESCMEPVNVTVGDYARLHDRDASYIVVPGHETIEVDDVVAEAAGYTLVEKTGVGR